jgi:hypothetical protein
MEQTFRYKGNKGEVKMVKKYQGFYFTEDDSDIDGYKNYRIECL